MKKKKEVLEYGAVLAVKGPYSGMLGFYDDDECDDKAVVYFVDSSGYDLIPTSFIVALNSDKARDWIYEHSFGQALKASIKDVQKKVSRKNI
jgi:hypothetical protein